MNSPFDDAVVAIDDGTDAVAEIAKQAPARTPGPLSARLPAQPFGENRGLQIRQQATPPCPLRSRLAGDSVALA